MSIFEYIDYKKWVISKIKSLPKQGRGQYSRIAEYLNTSPAIVTQVFTGDRELTPEQALLLADYFALTKLESRYFILLVNFARAGSHRYREKLKEEIDEVKIQSQDIKNRVIQNRHLSEETKAVLYSNWYYLAVLNLTAINGFNTLESIVERLGINKTIAREAIEFLLQFGLIKTNGEKLEIGPTFIHLDSKSPQIFRHHQNWRLQAFRHYEDPNINDTFYTAPMTLSITDTAKLKEQILKFISETVNTVKDSPSEELYCLCIDWFKI